MAVQLFDVPVAADEVTVAGYESSTGAITWFCGELGKSREHYDRGIGKQRALRLDMYDVDAIEAINFDQLATATDRLLLCGYSKRRANRASSDRLAELARPLARGSSPILKVEPEPPETTHIVRRRSRGVAGAAALVVSSAVIAFAAIMTIV